MNEEIKEWKAPFKDIVYAASALGNSEAHLVYGVPLGEPVVSETYILYPHIVTAHSPHYLPF